MTKNELKAQIDVAITNKTASRSISPINVGGNMKNIIDLIPDNFSTIIEAGNNIEITGIGTEEEPYIINSINSLQDLQSVLENGNSTTNDFYQITENIFKSGVFKSNLPYNNNELPIIGVELNIPEVINQSLGFQIGEGGFIRFQSEGGGNDFNFGFYLPDNKPNLNFPNINTYTLATLDDIPEVQDLQSVLEQGNTANNISIIFSNGIGEGESFSELNGTRLQMGTSLDGASVEYNTIEVRETYTGNLSTMTANGFHIIKLAQFGFDKDVNFKMNPDTPSNSSINLLSPNKTSGTYTIATLEDIYKIPNLQTYPDNASAITGGLVTDDIYKTSTGELRIVI